MRKIISDPCSIEYCVSKKEEYEKLVDVTEKYEEKQVLLRLANYYANLAGYHYQKMNEREREHEKGTF